MEYWVGYIDVIQNQEFSNYFRKLKPEEYELVAKSVLDYIIMMGGFGKR